MADLLQKEEFIYLPDEGLKAAFEVARDLNMPLLLTGEPGTGKTEFARWISRQLKKAEMVEGKKKESEPLRFDVKTTSTAKDLFYRYDAIRHFGNREREPNPMAYVTFEALGKAILAAGKNEREVVLVDEIDKAPRDFPNDVLFQFENYAFRVEEATDADLLAHRPDIRLDQNGNIGLPENARPPFLILTSNSEKNLPEAFLRRCVYYHIPFPKPDRLKEIVEAKLKGKLSPARLNNLEAIISYFIELRDRGLYKKPATAELLKWVESLEQNTIDWAKIKKEDLDQRLRHTLVLLLKTREDREAFNL